jgi:hypothetical protein
MELSAKPGFNRKPHSNGISSFTAWCSRVLTQAMSQKQTKATKGTENSGFGVRCSMFTAWRNALYAARSASSISQTA